MLINYIWYIICSENFKKCGQAPNIWSSIERIMNKEHILKFSKLYGVSVIRYNHLSQHNIIKMGFIVVTYPTWNGFLGKMIPISVKTNYWMMEKKLCSIQIFVSILFSWSNQINSNRISRYFIGSQGYLST